MFFRKSAHSAEMVVDYEELRDLDLECYNHISTAMTSSSDYVMPDSKSESSAIIEVVDKCNRNEQRRKKFEMKAKCKGKQKLEAPLLENRAMQRRLKLHKLAVAVSIKNTPNGSLIQQEEEDLFSDEEDIVDYPELETNDSDSKSSDDKDVSSPSTLLVPSTPYLPPSSAMKTRSLLSPWYSTQIPASVPEFCWTDHGI